MSSRLSAKHPLVLYTGWHPHSAHWASIGRTCNGHLVVTSLGDSPTCGQARFHRIFFLFVKGFFGEILRRVLENMNATSVVNVSGLYKRTNAKWTVFAGARKGQAMVQTLWETSGNVLNSTSESIRLLKKLLNWKNSFAGSSKKYRRGHFLFQRQKCPVPELSGQDKMNCSKFLLLVTKSKKVLFFCCSQLQERQFCEISVVPIQEQTERVGWFQDSFSPVSFSGFSSQHSPPIRGFVWLLIPSPTPPPICPRIWSKPLGKRTKVEWGWWAQAGKVRRQARQKCLQRWQRQKWDQTSRGKVPTKMKLFWRFRHMRTGD